jgi:hypothetical protein
MFCGLCWSTIRPDLRARWFRSTTAAARHHILGQMREHLEAARAADPDFWHRRPPDSG